MISCPYCQKELLEDEHHWHCPTCNLNINKVIAGKELTLDILEKLVNEGTTEVISGFISKKQKPFSAALSLSENKKIEFLFPDRKAPDEKENKESTFTNAKSVESIRVESGNSGNVVVIINGKTFKTIEIDFGLVGSRNAEMLGCLTAIKLIVYMQKDHKNLHLKISVNDISFIRYLLSESIPRKQEDKAILKNLFTELNKFSGWEAKLERKKRARLSGGPQAKKFPKGVFPYLEANIVRDTESKHILVNIPEFPEVQYQFQASFWSWRAQPGTNGEWILPIAAEKAVNTWLKIVKIQ